MSEKYELSRRKALAALGTIGVAGAGAGMGTSALLGDEEEFANNSITAGTTNLIAELGLVGIDSSAPDELEVNLDEGATVTADGDVAAGLTVGDMKPGDCIVLRATATVEDNPMYVAASADNVQQDGGVTAEPEPQDPADDDGELGDNLEITFGYDDDRTSLHDNTLEGSLTPDQGSSTLSGSTFLTNAGSGYLYRGQQGADPSSGPPGGHADGSAAPTRIGGDLSASNVDRTAVTHFIEVCLPKDVGNIVQGDSVSFDLVWSAEQVRNNAAPTSSDEVDGSVNS
jgi:hypothetical protein